MAITRYTVPPSGYQLPDAITLGPVRLQVADLTRSIDYYHRVLGLTTLRRDDVSADLGVDGPLVELVELTGATPVPRRGRLGLYHFALLLPSRADLGRFLRHLRTLGEQPGAADHLVSEALYLYDPDGIGIEVYADRPRAGWAMDGSSLAMASDPLDVSALDREAGSTAWTGAPTGTRMGHVHLYVDDLDQAAAFYHDGVGFDRISLAFPGALFMSAGGYHHHLGTNVWARQAPRAAPNDARMLEWRLVLPSRSDLDAVAASLRARGIESRVAGADLVTVDPWGTGVRFVESRPTASS